MMNRKTVISDTRLRVATAGQGCQVTGSGRLPDRVTHHASRITSTLRSTATEDGHHTSYVTCLAFSMVELLVAMTLLSLIVLVLMTVFNSTQRAFRSSVTQTDILEGSRAAMDLMTADLRNLTPSDGVSNNVAYKLQNRRTAMAR